MVGVSSVTFLYRYYYPLALVEFGLISSQFKIIYLLLLISSSLILFLKPRQEQHEITEQKAEHLNERIGEQEKETQRALSLKSEFIRNISHEYHAPQTGIYSMAESLLAGYHKFDDATRIAALKDILQSSLRLETFDTNISSLSRLSKADYKLNPEKLNFSDLLYERVSIIRKLYDEKHTDREFVVDIEEDLKFVGDRFYLIQAFDNLIINAISYCKEGKITVVLKRGDNNIEFSISDEGIGIPKEELYDIFAEFVVSSKTKSPAGNRGVGLALAKRVVEVHGGNIRAESDGIRGATIRVILPFI